MNEVLLTKLKKLLNLSKSANEHEAELALTKATALATEAGIDLAVVQARQDTEAEKLEMVQEAVSTGKRLPSLQKYASWLLKSHFAVEVIYSGGRHWGRTVNILGDKKDVEFAKFVNEFVQEEMQRRWENYKRSHDLSVKFKDTFMYNLYRGLDSKLADAKKAAEDNRFNAMPEVERTNVKAQYGIVVSNKAAAVKSFVNRTYSRLSSVKTRVNIQNNSTIASDGYSVGRSININRPIAC